MSKVGYLTIFKLKYNETTTEIKNKIEEILNKRYILKEDECYKQEFSEDLSFYDLRYTPAKENPNHDYVFVSFFMENKTVQIQFNDTKEKMLPSIKELLSLDYEVDFGCIKGIINSDNIGYDRCPELKELINSVNYKYHKGYDGFIEDSEADKIAKAEKLIIENYVEDIKSVFNIKEFKNIYVDWNMNFAVTYLVIECMDGMKISIDFSYKELLNTQCLYEGKTNIKEIADLLNADCKLFEDNLNNLVEKLK